ncbi:synaptic vesicle 2-related protein-like [Gigantopelta aegis]|uniref:synaptic vesicle 2-related protein-like n=1 Tax=Gigantopelta aegis TaxID=1735272 RepID=UPI001B8880E8|nr:synaptic vesicle 2-related protein-like [Gigantopelta aegis]
MFTKLIKFNHGDGLYEDIDGETHTDMDITDMQLGPTSRQSAPQTSGDPSRPAEPAEETFTIQQAIDSIGFGKFQIKLSILTGLAWMADAMEMMLLSILSPALHCQWQLEGYQEAFITTVVFLGMMTSSSIWGTICDKYGRRVALVLCSLFTFYYGILSAASPSYIWILILRGLVGFGIGGAPQAITLYSEFLPSKSRATCVVLIEVFWAIGACFEVALALIVMPTLGWQYLLGFSALPLLLFAIGCVWLPESARYDLTRGNPERAYATIAKIAAENNKPMLLGKLAEPIVKSGSTQEIKRGQFMDLFTPELRRTTVLLWIIWLVNAFSYYGIVLLTTALFETPDGCHGTDVKMSGQPTCMLECKTLTTKDYADLMWTTFAEFPGLFLTIILIEKIGRKKTMALEFMIFSLFVLLVNICTTRTVLTVFIFVARALISGAFQTAYVYTPEVYPTSLRAIGVGSCSGFARIGALTTPFVAQVLLKKSSYAAITVYGTTCLIATVAAMMLPIETKGRAMKDVAHEVGQN